jgi:hypothetical protein
MMLLPCVLVATAYSSALAATDALNQTATFNTIFPQS